MTYLDTLSFLGDARRFGMKLGLDPMRELARALGDPQKSLRFIHLAGTNGKGSTAAFCESSLRAAGFRVGLYTSPHLISIRERIQIDRVPITETAFAAGMEKIRNATARLNGHEATFFELITALALCYFAEEKVDWIIWETGLGGRLDATNIVDPQISIITNIGLDHQQYLGETERDIAGEKAGIIKPGVPVISAVEPGEASDVIRRRAQAENCPLTLVRCDLEVVDLGFRAGKQMARIDGHEFTLGLIGPHQVYNAACAIAALRQIRSKKINLPNLPMIPDSAIERGLAHTVWPGRFEILSENPLIILDGAHNPAGVKMLIETWHRFLAAGYGGSADGTKARAHLIFASVADKDFTEMVPLLIPLTKRVSLVRLANERSAEPSSLAKAFASLPCALYNSVSDLWQNLESFPPEEPVLITGSLFLVGEVLARRRGDAGEYRLNERLEAFAPSR